MTADDVLPPAAEARLRAALDAAATTDPVPDAWDAIHARITGDDIAAPRRDQRRPLPVLAVAAAVVVLVGLAALVVAVGRDDGGEVTAGPTGDLCAVLARPMRTGITVLVFLQVDADPDQIEGVAALIDGTPGVRSILFFGRDESFARAQELFADDPTMRDILRVENVPVSFGVQVDDRAGADALRTAVAGHPAVLDADTTEAGPIPDVATALEEIAAGEMEPFAASSWPADPDVIAGLRAAGPPELAADAALAADALAGPREATAEARQAAGTVATDAATRCGAVEESATGWYVPVDLPTGWTVGDVTAIRFRGARCDGGVLPTTDGVSWADRDREARVTIQSSPCAAVDGVDVSEQHQVDLGDGVTGRTSPAIDGSADAEVSWDEDGRMWTVSGEGVSLDEVVGLAREAVAGDPLAISPDGFAEAERWNAPTGPSVEVAVDLTAPSGTHVEYQLATPGHGIGHGSLAPAPLDLPGQDLPVSRLWDGDDGTFWAMQAAGFWPGADMAVMLSYTDGPPAAGSPAAETADREVLELIAHLRPATTAEWRTFLDDTTHTAVLDEAETFADLADIDVPPETPPPDHDAATTTSTAPG